MQNRLIQKRSTDQVFKFIGSQPQTQNLYQVKIVLHITLTRQARHFSSNYWPDLVLVVTAANILLEILSRNCSVRWILQSDCSNHFTSLMFS